ncbi:MAG TPA: hypothetical protein VF310_10490 [Vicinamibacteria bacterium]
MKLGETGEARVRGYLFLLRQSLRSFLPPATVQDALREIESHLRERLDEAGDMPNEAASVERVLGELGAPLQVARAYSLEMTLDEAAVTARLVPVLRALFRISLTTVRGFLGGLALSCGYSIGVSFILVALLKPIFPGNVGLFRVGGRFAGFGAQFPAPAGAEVLGGYWVIPLCLVAGSALTLFTHRCALRFLARWRARRGTSSPPRAL